MKKRLGRIFRFKKPLEVDPALLAENIRSEYFASAEPDGFEMLVTSKKGLVTVLLQIRRLYAFLLEEQWEAPTPFGAPKGGHWKMEQSRTGERALVWEMCYSTLSEFRPGMVERELSSKLIAAIKELEGEY